MTISAGLRDLQFELEQFLFAEARMLDERRFEEWLRLMEPDVRYHMPVRTNRTTRDAALEVAPPDQAAHFNDSFDHLKLRVGRLGTGQAWSEDPPSRTRHLVTNLMIDAIDETKGEYSVNSNFILYRTRGDEKADIYAGQRNDLLRRRADGSIGIAARTILLDQAMVLTYNMSVLF